MGANVEKLMEGRTPGDMPSPLEFHDAFDADMRALKKVHRGDRKIHFGMLLRSFAERRQRDFTVRGKYYWVVPLTLAIISLSVAVLVLALKQ